MRDAAAVAAPQNQRLDHQSYLGHKFFPNARSNVGVATDFHNFSEQCWAKPGRCTCCLTSSNHAIAIDKIHIQKKSKKNSNDHKDQVLYFNDAKVEISYQDQPRESLEEPIQNLFLYESMCQNPAR